MKVWNFTFSFFSEEDIYLGNNNSSKDIGVELFHEDASVDFFIRLYRVAQEDSSVVHLK